jgi:hypothetical protein
MSNIQINLRAPVTAKDVVQDVCTRLRSDPRFEERLRTFLANEGANADQDVRDAIEDLQHRVRMLEYDKKYPRSAQSTDPMDTRDRAVKKAREAGMDTQADRIARLGPDGRSVEATAAPAAALETGDRRDLLEAADSGHAGAGERYTYKSGNRTFVTEAGRAKIREMREAGDTAYNIAKVIGISGQGIRYQLQKMGLADRNE